MVVGQQVGSGYESNVNVTLGVWVRKSGSWVKITQVSTSFYGSYSTAGSKAYTVSYNGNVQLGNGIEAFGVTIDAVDGGTATGITLNQVSWTAQGASSSTRSALPNGATTTVTIRPK